MHRSALVFMTVFLFAMSLACSADSKTVVEKGVYTVQTNSYDVWGAADSLLFVYTAMSGDFEVALGSQLGFRAELRQKVSICGYHSDLAS